MNKKLEEDVRMTVGEIIFRGDGIVSGGAVNVDSIAVEEALKLDPTARRIKIFLPATLEIYAAHYRKRAREGVITRKQAENLITQLSDIKEGSPASIIENRINKIVNKETYYERNSAIIEAADGLAAFHVNANLGTKDTIDKAYKNFISKNV